VLNLLYSNKAHKLFLMHGSKLLLLHCTACPAKDVRYTGRYYMSNLKENSVSL
jgi:uncharacterized Zn finger protein (UPF0148 family)